MLYYISDNVYEKMCPKNCKVTTSTVKLKGETQVTEGSTVILLFSPIAKSTRKIVNYTWLDFLADIGGIFNQYLYILLLETLPY